MNHLNIIATITVKPEYYAAFQPILKKLVEEVEKKQVASIMNLIRVLVTLMFM
ncbi:hypothetical protein [Gilliamella apicola]|uniref:hypothetical protein n=1 Tax=Gilliamella apicola TaxID=1196095 RepID=UPI002741975D|nr:hypothetical protein [Gilliamella apicola]WLS90888.1 hypothetical protein RAM21_09485 [Gilliamella apicola]